MDEPHATTQGVVELPWEVPEEFLGQFEGIDSRYFALYWSQRINGAVILTKNTVGPASLSESLLVGHVYVWLFVVGFFDQHAVSFGITSPVTHWLIFDRETGLAWAAPVDLARRCVEHQKIEWEQR